ncbi:MAG: hypothetical protein U0842_21125 [Candidatus Binatia bacterium]
MLALLLLTAAQASALDVRIAWTPPADAAGYRLYVRQAGAPYGLPRDLGALRPDAGGVVRTVVSGLADGATSYMVVTSYTASGVESALSNEVASSAAAAAPTPAATPTPKATAAPTPAPTALPTATPKPSATPAPTAPPAPTASGRLAVPLDAWSVISGSGTWSTAWSADLAAASVRTTSAETTPTDYVIGYPGSADLGAALRSLTFSIRAAGRATVQAVVRTSTGRRRSLVYVTKSGSATKRASTATYPIGAGDATTFRTITRDLAADLKLAWGETFAAVDQVRLSGTLEAGNVVLGSTTGAPLVSSGLAIPLDGWLVRAGSMLANETDAELDAPVLHVEPVDALTRPVTMFPAPKDGVLIAPYGRLVLLVRPGPGFAIDVRVQTGDRGSYRLRYEPDAEPRAGGASATLPLIAVPSADSAWATVELDLAADLAAARPGVPLGGVQQIRVRGAFRAASVVAEAALTGAGGGASSAAETEE